MSLKLDMENEHLLQAIILTFTFWQIFGKNHSSLFSWAEITQFSSQSQKEDTNQTEISLLKSQDIKMVLYPLPCSCRSS